MMEAFLEHSKNFKNNLIASGFCVNNCIDKHFNERPLAANIVYR